MSYNPSAAASAVEAFIRRYWGKARDEAGGRWHPLAYHQADVAACAAAIAEVRPWLLDWMADCLGRGHGWDADAVLRLVALFGYAHDLGKHAAGFQIVAPYAYRACTGGPVGPGIVAARDKARHDALGMIAWSCGLPKAADLPSAILGDDWDDDWDDADLEAWKPLASAAFGHHGHPIDPTEDERLIGFHAVMHREDLDAAALSCARFRQIVGGIPTRVDPDGACRVSIPFAGLLQVADWMGSDRALFDYASPDAPLAEYWDRARQIARGALRDRGLLPARPAPWRGVAPLVAPNQPTPMQVAAATVALPDPFLAILEDTMGSGKTEAALALAHRAMADGLAHGMFVGLPTTATADAQAKRQAALGRVIFADAGPAPSFTVAHGRSDVRAWPASLDGASLAAAWIADERRLRLMADLCVGTVDQALLAVMATDFAAMRRFGLLGKVLVIDEVHAFDAYTLRLIEDLLREHAACGGSVVLLSATLTAAAKSRLLTAFRDGMPGVAHAADFACDPAAPYPALTITHAGGTEVLAIAKAPMAPPDKPVRLIRTEAEAEAALLTLARSGGCAAWVRVTVDDAIAAAQRLAAQHHDVTTLHSRIPAMQRNRIEAGLLGRFGKGEIGAATNRAGGLVVATSVIAASLDIDFDLVVVDLRGMDEALQAFGRGRRHRRARDGRLLPAGSRDERVSVPMLLRTPELALVSDGEWLTCLLGYGGAKVVGNAARAWRTAWLLEQTGHMRYGRERALIEAADDPHAAPTPAPLAGADEKAQAEDYAKRGTARHEQCTALQAREGYVGSGLPDHEDKVATRLDEVGSVEVTLVDATSTPRPLNGSSYDWSVGRIRLQSRRFRNSGEKEARALAVQAGLPRGHLMVPLRKEGDLWIYDWEMIHPAAIHPRYGLSWSETDR